MIDLIAASVFLGLLFWAAGCDIARMEIPNRISVLLACAYLPLALMAGQSLGAIGLHYAIGALALALAYLLFKLNVFGGGDAKILAAMSIWAGIGAMSPLLFWMAVAGGALSLLLIVARRLATPGPSHPAFLNRLLDREVGAPYVVALAAGGCAALPHLAILNLT